MSPPQRIRGVDALRFVLATVVVIGHFPLYVVDPRWPAPLRLLAGYLFEGPAAVIAFFVISGLCIHYPNRRASSVSLWPFYARREIRILVPVAVTILVLRLLGGRLDHLQDSTLWSLICEEIYYLAYPLLLLAFRRVGVRPLIVVAYISAYTMLVVVPSQRGYYADGGWRLTWLLGLPCWLLGCELAEQIDLRHDPQRATRPRTLWTLRTLVLGAAMLHGMLHSHPPFHLPYFRANWTLDVFALLSFFWLRAEVFYWGTRPAPAMERLGSASYSLYLTHTVSAVLWLRLGTPDVGALRLVFIFACAYLFYRAVEKPSHVLARTTAQRLLHGNPRDRSSEAGEKVSESPPPRARQQGVE